MKNQPGDTALPSFCQDRKKVSGRINQDKPKQVFYVFIPFDCAKLRQHIVLTGTVRLTVQLNMSYNSWKQIKSNTVLKNKQDYSHKDTGEQSQSLQPIITEQSPPPRLWDNNRAQRQR